VRARKRHLTAARDGNLGAAGQRDQPESVRNPGPAVGLARVGDGDRFNADVAPPEQEQDRHPIVGCHVRVNDQRPSRSGALRVDWRGRPIRAWMRAATATAGRAGS
jgi:hypothetical protein